MDQNDFSCIKQVTKTIQLTMPLKYTSNEIAGVTEILDGWKRQFVPKLQGVVVNYRDIRLTCRPFFIHVSRTAPRYDVTATFDLFCPSVGDIVKGKINRSSREHIGCLIEGTINATIHLPYDSSPNVSKFIHINRDILFQINRFEFNRHTIRVNGQITPECIKLMEELFPSIEDDAPENKSNGLTNSMLNFYKGDGFSRSESSGDESSNKLESIVKNPAIDSRSNADTSSDESKLCNSSTATSTLNESYKTAIHASIKEEMETENELCGNPSARSPKLKHSKKRKRDRESSALNSPEVSKKKRKNSKSELENEVLLLDASEPLTLNTKKKKKRKEKSTLSADLTSNMLNVAEFESQFAAFDPLSFSDTLQSIKREVVSPTTSTVKVGENEKKGKKRKRESSISDVNEDLHKSKGTKKKKKPKDKKKSKSSKTKGKIVTPGDILKKDKKNSKSKKKKKGDKKNVDSIGVPVSIKSELK